MSDYISITREHTVTTAVAKLRKTILIEIRSENHLYNYRLDDREGDGGGGGVPFGWKVIISGATLPGFITAINTLPRLFENQQNCISQEH
jgi:hypothetical protein